MFIFACRVMKHLQLKQVGRYYYDPNRPAAIPQHKIELWPGYITSIQCYEGTVYSNKVYSKFLLYLFISFSLCQIYLHSQKKIIKLNF